MSKPSSSTQNEASLQELVAENDMLKTVLCNSNLPCIFCQLSREDLAKCVHGFPGCSRADYMTIPDQEDIPG